MGYERGNADDLKTNDVSTHPYSLVSQFVDNINLELAIVTEGNINDCLLMKTINTSDYFSILLSKNLFNELKLKQLETND